MCTYPAVACARQVRLLETAVRAADHVHVPGGRLRAACRLEGGVAEPENEYALVLVRLCRGEGRWMRSLPRTTIPAPASLARLLPHVHRLVPVRQLNAFHVGHVWPPERSRHNEVLAREETPGRRLQREALVIADASPRDARHLPLKLHLQSVEAVVRTQVGEVLLARRKHAGREVGESRRRAPAASSAARTRRPPADPGCRRRRRKERVPVVSQIELVKLLPRTRCVALV